MEEQFYSKQPKTNIKFFRSKQTHTRKVSENILFAVKIKCRTFQNGRQNLFIYFFFFLFFIFI